MSNYNFDVISLPSEKEVFGFFGEDAKIVEVLKKCKINGDYNGEKLSPFIKFGTLCPITDFALLLGGGPYMVTTTPHEFGDSAVAYDNSGSRVRINSTDAKGVIRPIIDISETVDVSSLEDCAEIEYGEYPQMAPNAEMQKELEMAYQTSSENLKELDESYTINSYVRPYAEFKPLKLTTMMYNGKKYVRVPNHSLDFNKFEGTDIWVEVSPIKWILDKKEKKLVSKCGLVAGISLTEDFTRRYGDGYGFRATQLYRFLFDYLLPEMLQSSSVKKDMMTDEKGNYSRSV